MEDFGTRCARFCGRWAARIVGGAFFIGVIAMAQTPSPNPAANGYRELFIEASDRLVSLGSQLAAEKERVQQLQKELDAAKKANEK